MLKALRLPGRSQSTGTPGSYVPGPSISIKVAWLFAPIRQNGANRRPTLEISVRPPDAAEFVEETNVLGAIVCETPA